MSIYLMASIRPLRVSPTQKAVLTWLADSANDHGVCWPSVRSLCEWSCLGERTVQDALRWLHQEGLVRVEISTGRANRYTVMIDAIRARCAPVEDPRGSRTPAAAAPPRQMPLTPAPAAPHPRGSRTLTVREPIPNPPFPPSRGAPGLEGDRGSAPAAKVPAVPMLEYLAGCKERGELALPEADPVWDYADRIGLPYDFVRLAWQTFKRAHISRGSTSRDWLRWFRSTAVERNGYRLWLERDNEFVLSTQGVQAQRAIAAEQAATR